MGTHRIAAGALTLTVIICLVLVTGATSMGRAERGKQSLADTAEWSHLARLWQTMLDHSSNQIYSPALFQGLAGDMNAVGTELSALAQRQALPKPVADYLGQLFHTRYQYLADWHYTTRSSATVSAVEASRNAALWVVELQLSVLRRPALSQADRDLANAAESNISYHLTYLYHVDRLEEEVDRRRMELKKTEDAGAKVDWQPFAADVERRRNLLLDAYKQHHLPRVPLVKQALPYIVDLTRREPSPDGLSPGRP